MNFNLLLMPKFRVVYELNTADYNKIRFHTIQKRWLLFFWKNCWFNHDGTIKYTVDDSKAFKEIERLTNSKKNKTKINPK